MDRTFSPLETLFHHHTCLLALASEVSHDQGQRTIGIVLRALNEETSP